MDFYENWNIFIANIDDVPEQLDGDKLINMVSKLSRTREERELLAKDASAGVRTAWESLLNSYVPIIVEEMQNYVPRFGYNLNILINCVEKVRKQIVNNLYRNNLEYTISHSISWIVADEITLYIATKNKLLFETLIKEVKYKASAPEREAKRKAFEEMLERVDILFPDKNAAELVKDLLNECCCEKETQLIAFKFGLEDGVLKTPQETADKFGISSERVRQIEHNLLRKAGYFHIRKRKSLSDFLK